MNALLIPIYEPSDRVLPFLKTFKKEDFDAFLVVDDGSGEKYRQIFDEIAKETPFCVVSHDKNLGKGQALKTGISYLMEHYEDLEFIVTADGDGQHLRKDILRIKKKALEHPGQLVIGARDFSKAPPKSASGNIWSARFFRFATGMKVSDCQTGLRALPKESFSLALETYGNRFEYEMNFLMKAARPFEVEEAKITTVYEENNKGTHFRPVMDSFRIMGEPIAYLLVALISFGIDILAFALLSYFSVWGNPLWPCLIARAISLPVNYVLLMKSAFHQKGVLRASLWKYLLVAIFSFVTQYGISLGLAGLWGSTIWARILVGFLVGVITYFIHLNVTFAPSKRRK
ncbi:MAG: bifunctional glycosyltransferase family 2/GtrA family protein [Bacilli bacterium]|nr:bifunctional glycosyltransferase family 2/GtrA family protein [Bacilli bacterium]